MVPSAGIYGYQKCPKLRLSTSRLRTLLLLADGSDIIREYYDLVSAYNNNRN